MTHPTDKLAPMEFLIARPEVSAKGTTSLALLLTGDTEQWRKPGRSTPTDQLQRCSSLTDPTIPDGAFAVPACEVIRSNGSAI